MQVLDKNDLYPKVKNTSEKRSNRLINSCRTHMLLNKAPASHLRVSGSCWTWYRVRRNPELGCPAGAGWSNSVVMSRGFARCCTLLPGLPHAPVFSVLRPTLPRTRFSSGGILDYVMTLHCAVYVWIRVKHLTLRITLDISRSDLCGNAHYQVSRPIFIRVCKT